MKLTEEHFGKKMKLKGLEYSFFMPLAFYPENNDTDNVKFIGIDSDGIACFMWANDDWEFYEEPKSITYRAKIDGPNIRKGDLYAKYFAFTTSNSSIVKHPADFPDIFEVVLNPINNEEPKPKEKKRIESAPCVLLHDQEGYCISISFYTSEINARKWTSDRFIKWPADWDAVKGVWYYESE